jgi:hypothetical protein
MRYRRQDGVEEERELTYDELLVVMNNSLDAIQNRSAVVECATCGTAFLVNSQDFHQVFRCPNHKQE